MPRRAWRKGDNRLRVDCAWRSCQPVLEKKGIDEPTFWTLPATVTSVPRLVYSFWEADRVTERSE